MGDGKVSVQMGVGQDDKIALVCWVPLQVAPEATSVVFLLLSARRSVGEASSPGGCTLYGQYADTHAYQSINTTLSSGWSMSPFPPRCGHYWWVVMSISGPP